MLALLAVGLQSCGNPAPDPLARDVSRLAPGILPMLRAGQPAVPISDDGARADALRVLTDAVEAVHDPDPWVAECGSDAVEIYRGLIDGLASGDPIASRASAIVLDEPLPNGPETRGTDSTADSDRIARRLEGVRARFLAGVQRAAPGRETLIAFDVAYSKAGEGEVLTLTNTSGMSLGGVIAEARLIGADGSTVTLAYLAAEWSPGEARSARILPIHGTPKRGSITSAEIVEVRLLNGSLRSRPVRAFRPAAGWTQAGP